MERKTGPRPGGCVSGVDWEGGPVGVGVATRRDRVLMELGHQAFDEPAVIVTLAREGQEVARAEFELTLA